MDESTIKAARATVEVGQRFGMLTVLAPSPRFDRGAVFWVCECDCGNISHVVGYKLTAGTTRGCGCRNGLATTHGHVRRYKPSTEYRAWRSMRSRCASPGNASFRLYGGRGITVCERWMSFENFFADMGKKPSRRHSLDRIDSDGNYAPENCRWATSAAQQQNRRDSRLCAASVFIMRHLARRSVRVGDLAHAFGVSHRTASAIVLRRSWKEVAL